VEPSLSSRLGKGTFGTVFFANWKPVNLRHADRVVAIKVMTRFLVEDKDYLQAVQCAQEEAELIHNLCVQHGPAIGDFVMHVYGVAEGPLPPNLVSAFSMLGLPGEEGFGIVMSLAAGGTLANLLHGGLPLRTLTMLDKLSICAQLARGVAELHAVGVVHGDMKPDNVLFGDKDSVTSLKISDFGTARIRGQLESTLGQSTLQRTGQMKGTAS
jgi:serine/threonine protein kinase